MTNSDYFNYFAAVSNVEIFLANQLESKIQNEMFCPVKHSCKEKIIAFFKTLGILFSRQARALKQCDTDKKIHLLARSIAVINHTHSKLKASLPEGSTSTLSLAEKRLIVLARASQIQFEKLNAHTQKTYRIAKFIKELLGVSLGEAAAIKVDLPPAYPALLQPLSPFFANLRSEIWKGDYQVKKLYGYIVCFNTQAHYLMNPEKSLNHNLHMLDHWVLLKHLQNAPPHVSTFDQQTQHCYAQASTFEELCDLVGYVSELRSKSCKDPSEHIIRYSDAVEKAIHFFKAEDFNTLAAATQTVLSRVAGIEEQTAFKFTVLMAYNAFIGKMNVNQKKEVEDLIPQIEKVLDEVTDARNYEPVSQYSEQINRLFDALMAVCKDSC